MSDRPNVRADTRQRTDNPLSHNLGTRRVPRLRMADFPSADEIVREGLEGHRSPEAVDILLVNPPTPDGELWIRTQHRVGRRETRVISARHRGPGLSPLHQQHRCLEVLARTCQPCPLHLHRPS